MVADVKIKYTKIYCYGIDIAMALLQCPYTLLSHNNNLFLLKATT